MTTLSVATVPCPILATSAGMRHGVRRGNLGGILVLPERGADANGLLEDYAKVVNFLDRSHSDRAGA